MCSFYTCRCLRYAWKELNVNGCRCGLINPECWIDGSRTMSLTVQRTLTIFLKSFRIPRAKSIGPLRSLWYSSGVGYRWRLRAAPWTCLSGSERKCCSSGKFFFKGRKLSVAFCYRRISSISRSRKVWPGPQWLANA